MRKSIPESRKPPLGSNPMDRSLKESEYGEGAVEEDRRERRMRRSSRIHGGERVRRRRSRRERRETPSLEPPPSRAGHSDERSFKEWMKATRPVSPPRVGHPGGVKVPPDIGENRAEEEIPAPPSGRKKICLGKTQGLMAVGAWAARQEIADLLERGHTKEEILEAVREGVEHGPILQSSESRDHSLGSRSKRSWEESARSLDGRRSVVSEKMPQATVPFGAPSWVKPGPSASGAFRKKAEYPEMTKPLEKAGSLCDYSPSSSCDSDVEGFPSDREPVEHGGASGLFRKRAEKPVREPDPLAEEKKKAAQKAFPRRKNPSEQHLLEVYFSKARDIFEGFIMAGVTMDLVDLIFETGKDTYDEDKFMIYTEPRSVGTGLRYARLMISLLEFYKQNWGETCEEPKIIGKEVVLKFIEHRIKEGCGFRTPKAVLYALEYFGVILGFQDPGSRLPRCRKLAEDYAAKAPPRSPAKHISIDFMRYLEKAVLSESRTLAERIVCGKLRICSQASIRHDDLERTPLSLTEWVRLKGGVEIIGMRACAPVTKSGVRPWVASYLAVSPENDAWMSTFIELVIKAHGDSWSSREFFCPGFADDRTALGVPSTWSADVTIIKRMLSDDVAKGFSVPLDSGDIENFRWHGSKASMPTIMAHFGTKAKVIRYQGNWAKSSDTMPDTYLREAQVMVLRGQVEVLERIRAGETLDTLEGVPLREGGSDGNPTGPQAADEVPSPVGASPAEVKPARAMASTLDAGAEQNEGFRRDKLPLVENFPHQLADVNFKDFHERGVRLEEALEQEKSEEKILDLDTVSSLLDPFDAEMGLSSEDSEAEPEEKDMELLPCFVFSGSRGKKLHKPPLDYEEGSQEVVQPRCRAHGKSFEILDLGEALAENVVLCKRCFGADEKCNSVCTYMVKKKGKMVRCGRRCCLNCAPGTEDADRRPHSCPLHLEVNMDDDV